METIKDLLVGLTIEQLKSINFWIERRIEDLEK
jgi:hypothetical protein